MTYPAFPVAGSFPVFLNPFDPTYRTGAITALYGTVTIPVAAVGGGSVIEKAPWVVGGGGGLNESPYTALVSWSYVNIVPPGSTGITPPNYWPQIFGPRFAYWATDPGGVPFIT